MTRGADEDRKMVALRHIVGLLRRGEAGNEGKRNEPSRSTSKGHGKRLTHVWPRQGCFAASQAHSLMSLNAPIDMAGPE
jgi:hypothetical protein